MQDPAVKICFLGTSHAAQHLSKAAADKGFELVRLHDADIVFVSEDTPTNAEGTRDLQPIRALLQVAESHPGPIVLTSAVPPGFTRSLGLRIWHQAETLRMIDAGHRAATPEMFIIGCPDLQESLPAPYQQYLAAFECPILTMTWEEAEFAKLAINSMLAAQVDATNALAAAAEKVGAKWSRIANVLRHDARIGPYAYLEPGRWENSPHLLRDFVTLCEIENR
jgi:UDPglucose 6-dehydrogenase